MAQSLYEICRGLVEAYRRQDVPQMNQSLRALALFFPSEGESSGIKSFSHTILNWLPPKPGDSSHRDDATGYWVRGV